MKITRAEKCIIAFTLLFLVFTVGVHIGTRGSRQNMVVSSEISGTLREREPESAAAEASGASAPAEKSEASDALTEKININTADAEELSLLNGIGEKLSARIVKYREENGPFKTEEDIMNVSGIGSGIYAKICGDITVD